MNKSTRCLFVGNIPYGATEEMLREVFAEVGQILSFRLVSERETGKSKGYGFCEYKDAETALMAMRKLNSFEILGRTLRLDFAETDRSSSDHSSPEGNMVGVVADNNSSGGGGNNNNRGISSPPRGGGGGSTSPPHIHNHTPHLPTSTSILSPPMMMMTSTPPSSSTVMSSDLSVDTVVMYKAQLYETLWNIKSMIQGVPDTTKVILKNNPMLTYSILQSQIVLGLIPDHLLLLLSQSSHQLTPSTSLSPPPSLLRPQPSTYPPQPQPPPSTSTSPPSFPSNIAGGVSSILGTAVAAMTGGNANYEQMAYLMNSILSLTPQQLDQLDPDQRRTIHELQKYYSSSPSPSPSPSPF